MDEWDELFDWDESNEGHVARHVARHGVEPYEVEEALLDPEQVSGDAFNVGTETRDAVIGKTDDGAILFVVYTIRNKKVRPISAREATDKEKRRYRR